MGYGWVDFMRSIGAVVLFVRGFGEIIRPAQCGSEMCLNWKSLPSHRYYLAISMADLSKIMAKHGDPGATPPRPVHELLWHCPTGVISTCSCQSPGGGGGEARGAMLCTSTTIRSRSFSLELPSWYCTCACGGPRGLSLVALSFSCTMSRGGIAGRTTQRARTRRTTSNPCRDSTRRRVEQVILESYLTASHSTVECKINMLPIPTCFESFFCALSPGRRLNGKTSETERKEGL